MSKLSGAAGKAPQNGISPGPTSGNANSPAGSGKAARAAAHRSEEASIRELVESCLVNDDFTPLVGSKGQQNRRGNIGGPSGVHAFAEGAKQGPHPLVHPLTHTLNAQAHHPSACTHVHPQPLYLISHYPSPILQLRIVFSSPAGPLSAPAPGAADPSAPAPSLYPTPVPLVTAGSQPLMLDGVPALELVQSVLQAVAAEQVCVLALEQVCFSILHAGRGARPGAGAVRAASRGGRAGVCVSILQAGSTQL